MVRFSSFLSLYSLPRGGPFLVVRERPVPGDGYRFEEDEESCCPSPPSPVPDPFDDAAALEDLEEEIAILSAHIHAATHRLLTLIAQFDRRRGWELGGHRSCAHWLSVRTGIDLGTAREKVRTARVLVDLPETSASMARGELSFSQVRALSRVATAETEGALLELARGCTTAELERMVRGFRRGSREDEKDAEQRRHRERRFSVAPDLDGMYVVRGRLPAEVGVLLMRAVEAASDALYREEGRAYRPSASPGDNEREAAQRRADALGLMAERAMAAGFGGGGEGGGEGCSEGAERPIGTVGSGGRGGPAGALPVPISGSRAERYQVVLHVDAETLEAGGESGRSEMEDGTRVSYETSRRLSCDAGVVEVMHAADGRILDVGRRRRTVPPAIRRALEARDGGCRFPGCGLRFSDAHHVTHWGDGGETKMENLVLLCRHHHRLVHEGGWRVEWWGWGRPVFYDPRGGTHYDGRWRLGRKKGGAGEPRGKSAMEPVAAGAVGGPGKAPAGGRSGGADRPVDAHVEESRRQGVDRLVDTLVEENRRRGVEPHAGTLGARWRGPADVPNRIWFGALEAVADSGV